MTRDRLHELDALRSVLMLLGIVLHAAAPYRTDTHWLVTDPAGHVAFDLLDRAIHAFRMPAFFVVAGYFAMLLLRRREAGVFLRERLRRTLLPAAMVLVGFNLFQTWWLADPAPATALAFWRDDLLPAWRSGALVGHLWFLVHLAIYCSVLALARPWLLRRVAGDGPARLARSGGFTAMLVAAASVPLAVSGLVHVAPGLADEAFGLFDPMELLDDAVFFAIGAILQTHASLMARFLRAGRATWWVLLAAPGAWWLVDAGTPGTNAAMALLAEAALAWALVRLLFAGFSRHAHRPSRIFRYLSDASYSMYLFHHLFVVVIASRLLPVAWPVPAKFGAVLAGSSAVSLALHHWLVRPFATMRWLFNGAAPPARHGHG